MADSNNQKKDLKPETAPAEPEKKQGLTSKQKMVLIIAGAVLVCATAVAIVWLLRKPAPAEEEQSLNITPIINAENVREIEQEIEDKVAKGMFETYMNTTWTFPDGKSASSDAIMGNSASNNYAFYFTVTLKDTNETVFTSGVLPLGSQIEEIKLETELKEGTYPAAVTIYMIDDDGEPIKDGNTGINVTIIIQK